MSEEACGRGGAQLAPSNENPLLLKEPGGVPLPSAVRDTAKINLHYPSCTRPQDFPPALCLMTVSSSIFTLSVVGRMKSIAAVKLNGWKTMFHLFDPVYCSMRWRTSRNTGRGQTRREIRLHVYQRGGNQSRNCQSDALLVPLLVRVVKLVSTDSVGWRG